MLDAPPISESHAPAQASRSSEGRPAPAREARSASDANGPPCLARGDERADLLLLHAEDVAEPDADAGRIDALARRAGAHSTVHSPRSR